MQWMFLVLALAAALMELHTGTFYLAAISLIALIVFALGFFVRGEFLVLLFLALSVASLVAIWAWRRHRRGHGGLGDLDLGQIVVVAAPPGADGRLRVNYRGTHWEAVMAGGSAPATGAPATIIGRDGNVLRLAVLNARPAPRNTGETP